MAYANELMAINVPSMRPSSLIWPSHSWTRAGVIILTKAPLVKPYRTAKIMTPESVSVKFTGSQITRTVIDAKNAMTEITRREPNLSAR